MARNTFHVDHQRLRQELTGLEDKALFGRYEDANDSLNGPDSLGMDMVQDSAMLEEMAVQDRAVLKIAGEILRERGLLDPHGFRIAKATTEPPPEPLF